MLRRAVKRLVLFGARPVHCELCGEVLFSARPIVWRGEVKVLGAEQALVRVDFASMNRLVFRHLEADRCPPLRAAP
jgi:hypothetical protein